MLIPDSNLSLPLFLFGNHKFVFYVCGSICFVYKFTYHILDSTYMQYYMIFVFILLTSLSKIKSRSMHVAANGLISFLNTMQVKVSVAQSCLN